MVSRQRIAGESLGLVTIAPPRAHVARCLAPPKDDIALASAARATMHVLNSNLIIPSTPALAKTRSVVMSNSLQPHWRGRSRCPSIHCKTQARFWQLEAISVSF